MLLSSGGNTSELLIVTHKSWWEGAIGDTIKATLGSANEWLMQDEATYLITRIPPKSFEGPYQKQRNILIIARAENLSKAKIDIKKDVWASPQIIVKISIPNESSFAEIYTKYYPQISELFHQNELIRLNKSFSISPSKVVSKQVEEKFNIKLQLPKGYVLSMDTTDFVWLRCESRDIEQGILIYSYPYSDTSQFGEKKVIEQRNLITKKYIPGPVEKSYMQVSQKFPPYSERTEFKKNYAILLRSWWELDKYPMGGPFLSYTFYDEKNKRMLVLDSYVYAPNKDKRDILIQIEAVFDTFEFL